MVVYSDSQLNEFAVQHSLLLQARLFVQCTNSQACKNIDPSHVEVVYSHVDCTDGQFFTDSILNKLSVQDSLSVRNSLYGHCTARTVMHQPHL